MYLQHFNLAREPFPSAPDSHCLLSLNNCEALFKEIIKSVNSDESAVIVEGTSGSGKTSLCRKLLNALRVHKRYVTLELRHANMSKSDLYVSLAEQIKPQALSKQPTKKNIETALHNLVEAGDRPILVVDNAEALPKKTRKAILRLASFTHNGERLLRVVMFANSDSTAPFNASETPLFDECLGRRVALTKIKDRDVGEYLSKRLDMAGSSDGTNTFTDKAIKLISKSCDGCPRLINLIAHKAMLIACQRHLTAIDHTIIEHAIEQTDCIVQPEKTGFLDSIRTHLFS